VLSQPKSGGLAPFSAPSFLFIYPILHARLSHFTDLGDAVEDYQGYMSRVIKLEVMPSLYTVHPTLVLEVY